jgi:hypothetical protein
MFINLLLGSLLFAAACGTPSVHLVVAKVYYEGEIYELSVQAFDKKENANKLCTKIQEVYNVPCYIVEVKIDKKGIDKDDGQAYIAVRHKAGKFEFMHIFGDYDLAVEYAISNYNKDKSYDWYLDNVVYGDHIDLFPDSAAFAKSLTVNNSVFSVKAQA